MKKKRQKRRTNIRCISGTKYLGSSIFIWKTCCVQVAMQALGKGAYLPLIRDHIVQAQYFKDPLDLEAYLEHNVFLPDINNEVEQQRKPLYAYNLNQLDKFVMVRFSEDFTGVSRTPAAPAIASGTPLLTVLRGFWTVTQSGMMACQACKADCALLRNADCTVTWKLSSRAMHREPHLQPTRHAICEVNTEVQDLLKDRVL